MTLPWSDSREILSLVHSFLEGWALFFFVIVVACDLSLHFLGEKTGPTWRGWGEFTRTIILGKRSWTVRFPAYRCLVELRSLLKLLSVISFAIAITLESFGYPYGKHSDEFANKEIALSNQKALEALRKSAVAANDLLTTKAQLISEQANLQKQLQITAIAQEEAAVAQLALDRQVRSQGPRWRLLQDAAPDLAKKLSPFAGQRVNVVLW